MKKILIILIIIFIGIQFFHPAKNIATNNTAFANDISTVYLIPDSVHQLLKTSCYDCHSNSTNYPWYNNIEPVAAWWLNNHINDGKRALNFSLFATYSINKQYKRLNGIIKEIQSDDMPLSSYTLIHRNAVLSSDQKNIIINWVTVICDSIKTNTPVDSLRQKQ